jgi:hypothetical protein
MKQHKIYKRRFKEEDDIPEPSGDTSTESQITDNGYKVVKSKDGYKSFKMDDENSFTLDKVAGYEIDPYFKTLYKTENNAIKSKNFFFTVYWGGKFPHYDNAAISNNETELYNILKDNNVEEALEGKYLVKQGKVKYSYRYQEIWPFEDGK